MLLSFIIILGHHQLVSECLPGNFYEDGHYSDCAPSSETAYDDYEVQLNQKFLLHKSEI